MPKVELANLIVATRYTTETNVDLLVGKKKRGLFKGKVTSPGESTGTVSISKTEKKLPKENLQKRQGLHYPSTG